MVLDIHITGLWCTGRTCGTDGGGQTLGVSFRESTTAQTTKGMYSDACILKRTDEMSRALLRAVVGLRSTGNRGKVHTREMEEAPMKRGAVRSRHGPNGICENNTFLLMLTRDLLVSLVAQIGSLE